MSRGGLGSHAITVAITCYLSQLKLEQQQKAAAAAAVEVSSKAAADGGGGGKVRVAKAAEEGEEGYVGAEKEVVGEEEEGQGDEEELGAEEEGGVAADEEGGATSLDHMDLGGLLVGFMTSLGSLDVTKVALSVFGGGPGVSNWRSKGGSGELVPGGFVEGGFMAGRMQVSYGRLGLYALAQPLVHFSSQPQTPVLWRFLASLVTETTRLIP